MVVNKQKMIIIEQKEKQIVMHREESPPNG
jgi:hypothetical protein